MAMEFLLNRIKALFTMLVGVLRRAMCCFRRRRRSSCDSIPLSTVGIVPNSVNNQHTDQEQWEQWEENPVVVVPNKPVNAIQAKIEEYRQQTMKPLDSENQEPLTDFFEDMTPKITRQTRVLIKDKKVEDVNWNATKFAVVTDPLPTRELREWEDNATSWEEETIEEFGDATRTLREQRRREREQRLFEQQQKRVERNFRPQPLGAKLGS